MIHARFWGPGDANAPEDKTLQLTLTASSIGELHHILRRALNCEDPQKYRDWVELCDRLDALKASGKI